MLPLAINDVNLQCVNKAAHLYRVPAKLIIAVLSVERGKSGIIHKNKNGSYDLGEMQINTRWWPTLYKYHITPQEVLYQPCINLSVGTWILAKAIAESNGLLEGIGNYHSHTPIYNHAYLQKVQEKYTALQLGTRLA